VATVKEVAERSGVSRVTASAVINGRGGISEKTRQKVLESCRELNFKPRQIQRANAARFSKMIGVIVRDLNNPFYSQLIQGISTVLKKHNYRMLCFDSHGELEEELGAIEAYIEHPVGGLVLTPSDHLERISPEEHLKPLIDHRIPVVAISSVPGQTINVLEFDEKAVGHMATDYLIAMGHRRIYHLAGPQTYPPATDRQVAFIQALVEHDIPFDANAILKLKGPWEADVRSIKEALPSPINEPIALFCFNDVVAIAVYKAVRELGLRIPEDVSIIGCDDIELASAMSPSLTTIALPTFQMGVRAGEILVDSINSNGSEAYVRQSFAPKLVERSSVRRLQR
jgi:DNA-binding LacI/PurR family transcriptional regulator